jgi:3-oxoacyl-[acyl-carrier-protein] synthase II
VITGVGVLACNGLGREAFWDAIQRGASGIRPITRFDASEFPCRIGGELRGFDPNDYMNKGDVKRWHGATQQAVAAASQAIEESELMSAGYDSERIAVGIGTSVGGLDEAYEDQRLVYENKGWEHVEKLHSSASSGHAATANVSAKFKLRGPAVTIGSGCATGVDQLAWGKKQVQLGLADAAVVGATENPLTRMVFATACALGIVSQCNDEPEKAMRPFDRTSDGLVLSESAVVLVLERADRARARGARIFAEVAGCGSSSEGNNPIILERDGHALARAMQLALSDAGMQPEDVDCAQCHGVALKNYDRMETQAYRRALGPHAYRIPITATKSMIGQSYSVGGLLGVAAALLTIETGVVPPTINLTDPDPECDLDFVPLAPRMNDVRSAIVTALSFGGTHSATVLRRVN